MSIADLHRHGEVGEHRPACLDGKVRMRSATAWVRRAFVEPVWARYTGTERLRVWRELEESQWWPEWRRSERQSEHLRELVAIAGRECVFYGRRFAHAGINPESVRTLDDLRSLPVLTKGDIRTNGTDLVSRRYAPSALMQFRTGGSTGVPLTLFAAEAVSEARNAAARRSDRWTGWEVGEPVAAVWGNPKRPTTVKGRLHDALLEPVIYLDTMNVTPFAVVQFSREWRRAQPTLLFGHAHSLYLLALHVRDLGLSGIAPRAIVSTSMTLLAAERALIEEVFGLSVFDRYGCEEVGLIGCECEKHSGMHINVDHLLVEFLRDDGSAAGSGEPAQVVVTDLLNKAMPLIRYRVEDVASFAARPCACGRTLPLMNRIAGRTADFLVRGDGSRVAGISLIENSLTKFAGLAQMQIVQDDLLHVLLRVVPDDTYSDTTGVALTTYFSETFPGAEVRIELRAEIPREANGKYRFAICRV